MPSTQELLEQRKRIKGWFDQYRPGRGTSDPEVDNLLRSFGSLEDIRKAVEAEPESERMTRRNEALKRQAEGEVRNTLGPQISANTRRAEGIDAGLASATQNIPNYFGNYISDIKRQTEQAITGLNTARANTEKFYNDTINKMRLQSGVTEDPNARAELETQVSRLELEKANRLSDYERDLANARSSGESSAGRAQSEQERMMMSLQRSAGLAKSQLGEESMALEQERPIKVKELLDKLITETDEKEAKSASQELDEWIKNERLALDQSKAQQAGQITPYQNAQIDLGYDRLNADIDKFNANNELEKPKDAAKLRSNIIKEINSAKGAARIPLYKDEVKVDPATGKEYKTGKKVNAGDKPKFKHRDIANTIEKMGGNPEEYGYGVKFLRSKIDQWTFQMQAEMKKAKTGKAKQAIKNKWIKTTKTRLENNGYNPKDFGF